MSFSVHPPQKADLPKNIQDGGTSVRGLKVTAISHQHILFYNPKYLIIASDRFFEQSVKKKFDMANYNNVYSLFRPFLSATDDEKVMVLDSPYLKDAGRIMMKRQYENDMFIVFKVAGIK